MSACESRSPISILWRACPPPPPSLEVSLTNLSYLAQLPCAALCSIGSVYAYPQLSLGASGNPARFHYCSESVPRRRSVRTALKTFLVLPSSPHPVFSTDHLSPCLGQRQHPYHRWIVPLYSVDVNVVEYGPLRSESALRIAKWRRRRQAAALSSTARGAGAEETPLRRSATDRSLGGCF